MRRRFIRRTKQGRVLRFAHAQEIIDIPLLDSLVYLGRETTRPPDGRAERAQADRPTMHLHLLCNSQTGPSTGKGFKSSAPNTTWIIFIQPGPTSSLALLFQMAQKWKQSQMKGAVDRPQRSGLTMCLFEHLLKILQNLKDPLLAKAKDQNWLTEEGWRYQTWSGPLFRTNGPPDLMAMLETMLPLLGTPYMVNRFHANGGLKETSSKVVVFQLEISSHTPRCQKVWQALEQLVGLTALQLVGIQLKRDSLKQSPAADAVQQLSFGSAD